MVFAYYKNLNKKQQLEYRKSDRISNINLPENFRRGVFAKKLEKSLEKEDRLKIKSICQKLAERITTSLNIPRIRVKVLAIRPVSKVEELYALYEPLEGRKAAVITLWMRTAKRHQVVAFRTFLRTLLHEICHHIDYELLKFSYSFHTEGFYSRENRLFYQLIGKKKKGTSSKKV